MNRENIKRVRDVIAALPPERFDMRWLFAKDGRGAGWRRFESRHATIVKGCNTAACIAGWTLATLRPKSKGEDALDASDLLGLSDAEGGALFSPPDFDEPGRYTHAHAVRVLDRLLETGKVDWAAAQAEGQQ